MSRGLHRKPPRTSDCTRQSIGGTDEGQPQNNGLALSALTIIVPDHAALAQNTVRVRGTIESIDGPTYTKGPSD